MIGYYIMSSPSQNVSQQEAGHVIEQSDLRAVADCVVAAQNAAMSCVDFENECTTKYGISTNFAFIKRSTGALSTSVPGVENSESGFGSMHDFCNNNYMNDVMSSTDYSNFDMYIFTSSNVVPESEYNNIMDILEKYYSDIGTLGIIKDSNLVIPGSASMHEINSSIKNSANLETGQLLYMTQYMLPEIADNPVIPDPNNDSCPSGMVLSSFVGYKTCIGFSDVVTCQADTVYNSESGECEPNENFVCENENATLAKIDYTWTCIEPNNDIDCSNGVLVLNSGTLEYECVPVSDPETVKNTCNKSEIQRVVLTSQLNDATSTLKVKTMSCSRCEKPVVELVTIGDEQVCETYCVPDPSKINNRSCFCGDPESCTGDRKAIYFGFSKQTKVDESGRVKGIGDVDIYLNEVLDEYHEQNRKFNCLKCTDSAVDTTKSTYPYVAVCQDNQGETELTCSGATSLNIEKTDDESGKPKDAQQIKEDEGTPRSEATGTPEKTDGDLGKPNQTVLHPKSRV